MLVTRNNIHAIFMFDNSIKIVIIKECLKENELFYK